MISEIRIDTIGDLIEFAFSMNSYYKRIDRYLNNFVFRGHNYSRYLLSSSLKRNTEGNEAIAETRLLLNFHKYGQIVEPRVTNSVWENMVIAQHHGVPTRLLDWTYSPLVALHFATDHIDAGSKIGEDAIVWAISVKELNALLPMKYINVIRKYNSLAITYEMMKELDITIENYESDMGENSFVFFEPPSIDARIVNQASVFSILPRLLDPLDGFLLETPKEKLLAYKLIIPVEKIYYFRDQLDLMNISERILFPGLDGTARWMRRRYYHRPKDSKVGSMDEK